ncbi:MAG: Ig-like domain-containing protein [Clostridiales bacterium]|nr:Ig-like domain-containing protein [Clostridiales bacterium]
MRYCIYCGKQIKENQKFCPYCGKSQEKSSSVPAENKNSGDRGTGKSEQGEQNNRGGKGSKKPLLIVIIIVIAALAVGAILVWKTGLPGDLSFDSDDQTESMEDDEDKSGDDSSDEDLSAEEEESTEEEEEAENGEYELTLDSEELTLTNSGEMKKISVTTTMEDDSEIVWTSSDEAVATVDEDGYVTAVSSGEAVITAECGTLSASCTVICDIEEEEEEGELISAESVKLENITASATSQLDDWNDKTYGPANLFDDDLSTAYVEGVDGVGVGEGLTISLKEDYYLDKIVWYPGYQASSDLLGKNGYPTELTFSFPDGTTVVSKVTGNINPGTGVAVSIPEGVTTNVIYVTIDAAVEGSKYDDTCISEMEIYGIGIE